MNTSYAKFDLHNHSEWSYDAHSPVEFYFQRARNLKLRAFAITDHHNFAAIDEILAAAAKYPHVPFITGVEFTGKFIWKQQIRQWDMVALGLPLQPEGKLKAILDKNIELMQRWEREFGDNLCRLGVPYTRECREMLLHSYKSQKYIDRLGITRIHIALQDRYLSNSGLINKENADLYMEAARFMEYDEGIKDYEHFLYLPVEEISDAVHEAGGRTFIAHPTNLFGKFDPDRIIELVRIFGADGIECAHPAIPHEYTSLLRQLCLKHHLLSTAGCDTHDPYDDKFAQHIGEQSYLDEMIEHGIKIWNK